MKVRVPTTLLNDRKPRRGMKVNFCFRQLYVGQKTVMEVCDDFEKRL